MDTAAEPLAKIASPLQLHTTDRANFRSCRLKWHFSSNLRLNLRPERTNENLFFGSAIHAGLEAYYNNDKSLDAALLGACNYLFGVFQAEYEADSGEDQDYFSDLYLKAQGMLRHYHSIYKNDGLKAVQVEAKFEVPIGDCPTCGGLGTSDGPAAIVCTQCNGTGEVLYAGQVDALVQDTQDRYWIMEHKTADKIVDDTEYLQLDNQCTSYLWALSVTMPEIKIEGVIYNTLRKEVPKPLKINNNGAPSMDRRQQTPYPMAYAQIKEIFGAFPIPNDILDFLEMLRARESADLPHTYSSPFLRRVPVRRTAHELASEFETIKMEMADMLNDPNIYKNPNRFNCGGCSFTGPCVAYYAGADVQAMLDGSYIGRD